MLRTSRCFRITLFQSVGPRTLSAIAPYPCSFSCSFEKMFTLPGQSRPFVARKLKSFLECSAVCGQAHNLKGERAALSEAADYFRGPAIQEVSHGGPGNRFGQTETGSGEDIRCRRRRCNEVCRYACRGYVQSSGGCRFGDCRSRTHRNQPETAAIGVGYRNWIPRRVVQSPSLNFSFPRTLFEPPTVFKIGYASDYALGVDTKWQQKYRIWVDRTPDRVFVIYARCTHLGCTPDWKAGENKFKCPCHGKRLRQRRVSISRDQLRARWIARTWNSRPTVKSSWTLPGSISGPRDNQATSVIRDHFCRCNWWRCGSVPNVRERREQIEPLQNGRAENARRENAERKKWQVGWAIRPFHSGHQRSCPIFEE